MTHSCGALDSTAITSEVSVVGSDEDSHLVSKPKFNSTAVTFEECPFVSSDDWKSVNSSLRLSPILREARSPLMTHRKICRSEDLSPVPRRECEHSLDDTSQFVSRNEQSHRRERRIESSYETSVDSRCRRLQLIEENKENELDEAHEHPGTSTPVRCDECNETAETTRSNRLTNPFESRLLESLCVKNKENELDEAHEHPGTSTPVRCDECNETAETTRSNRLTNPFESRLLESLCVSTFSPSLFSSSKSPPKKDDDGSPKFRWSIDQIAILNPADIDESKADLVESPDPIFEARVQGAIDKFWKSQKFVMPSPDANLVMSNSSSRTERSPFQQPSTKRPSLYRNGNRNMARMEESPLVRPGFQRVNSSLRRTKETQTLLTFPPDFDLVKLLGGRFQYDEEGGADEAVFDSNLSLNTLRRKLFASECDSSFSSKGNDNESLNATRNTPSPQLLTFNDDDVSDDEPSDSEYLEGDISTSNDVICSPHIGRRRMTSPDMSPIRFVH
uniref:Protein aurora borealis n=1 Tax=Ascaris lumbricoides TaxID=6252 RepID=A0A9J2PRD5_ASCLU